MKHKMEYPTPIGIPHVNGGINIVKSGSHDAFVTGLGTVKKAGHILLCLSVHPLHFHLKDARTVPWASSCYASWVEDLVVMEVGVIVEIDSNVST